MAFAPRVTSRVLPAALAVFAGAARGAPPTIHSVGTLAGGTYSRAAAVTQDGQVVTGIADLVTDELWGDRAFRWTLGGGIQSLGTPTGLPWTAGNSIGGVGNAVAGNASNRAFRWTSTGGMQNLGTLPGGTLAIAFGLTADGSTVVGNSNNPSGYWAFRWTASTGMQILGALPGGTGSSATGITPDGLTIVGVSGWTGTGSRAFRWTNSGGFQNLGTLPGGGNSYAHAVNAAGTVVVGESDWSGTGRRATRWTGTSTFTTLNLGAPAGATDTIAAAVNADGQSVVGYAIHSFGRRAILWTPGTLMVDLNAYIPSVGLPLAGWVLEEARGVSADGSVIVGYGTFNGQQRGFVLRNVPCPSGPVIITDPTDMTVCVGGGGTLAVGASAVSAMTYAWEWRPLGQPAFEAVVDGPNGAHPTLGPSFNASLLGPSLDLSALRPGPDLEFRAIVTNPCGSQTSQIARVRVCVADLTCDGIVDFNDFLEFLNLYNAGDPRADLNGDSVVDFNDFLEYLNLYNRGC